MQKETGGVFSACPLSLIHISYVSVFQFTQTLKQSRFHRLLSKHFEGIIAHATYDVSSGKIEGINNKIKTLRRQGYGYPDDDYFFLKLFDLSRAEVVRNPKSHRKSD